MTREEQIIEAAYKEAEIERQLKMHPQVFEQGFVAGAQWADDNPATAAMVDKACRWLENYLKPLPHELDEFINERNLIIERFRKAMEK